MVQCAVGQELRQWEWKSGTCFVGRSMAETGLGKKKVSRRKQDCCDEATDLVVDIRHFVTQARRVGWVNFETEI